MITHLVLFTHPVQHKVKQAQEIFFSFEQTHIYYRSEKRFPVMGSEKDSDYETYGLTSQEEYATPYTRRDDSVYTKPYAIGSEAGFQINARSRISLRLYFDCHPLAII